MRLELFDNIACPIEKWPKHYIGEIVLFEDKPYIVTLVYVDVDKEKPTYMYRITRIGNIKDFMIVPDEMIISIDSIQAMRIANDYVHIS